MGNASPRKKLEFENFFEVLSIVPGSRDVFEGWLFIIIIFCPIWAIGAVTFSYKYLSF